MTFQFVLIFNFKHCCGQTFHIANSTCNSHTLMQNMAGSPFRTGVSLSSAKLQSLREHIWIGFISDAWIPHQNPSGSTDLAWNLYTHTFIIHISDTYSTGLFLYDMASKFYISRRMYVEYIDMNISCLRIYEINKYVYIYI